MSAHPAPASPRQAPAGRVTATRLRAMKQDAQRIAVITAYDYPFARIADQSGADVVLVGDSLGMVVYGLDSTLPVTMDDMVRHTAAVSRACVHALVVADMPFMSYQADRAEAMRNAARLVVEGGAGAVKVEGAAASTLDLIRGLTEAGIPVMGHAGLTPQSVNVLGGYKTQARESAAAAKLLDDCTALEDAGAFAIVLECIPAEIAEKVTALLEIPTIGIGAGIGCDGEVQVLHDVLGLGDFLPRHARRFAQAHDFVAGGIADYVNAVRTSAFPGEEQTVHVDAAVATEAVELHVAARLAAREEARVNRG